MQQGTRVGREEGRGLVWGVGLLIVLSYLLLVFSWFDHDIETPLASIHPAIPASLLVFSLGLFLWLRGIPRPFADRRDIQGYNPSLQGRISRI